MQYGRTYIVRPRIEPRKRSMRIAFMSSGSIQLLVAPASLGSRLQMNVRSSTRATSVGSEAHQNEFGFLSGVQPDEGAVLDQQVGDAGPLLRASRRPTRPGRAG